MRILVTGASGFLGHNVIARLLERGHDVRAIIRPTSTLPELERQIEIFHGDLRVHDNLSAAFEGIDAVLHLAAATSGNEDAQFNSSVVATERFLDAMAKSTVTRLVHVSSLVVYDWAQARSTMDESTPLLENPYEMGGYTIAKCWQERLVHRYAQAHSWNLTIARPGFIWGAERAEIAGMGRHAGRIYLMFGPFTRLPLCHVSNCADCLVSMIENSSIGGHAFNVVDGDDIRVWRYLREYVRRTDPSALILPVPYLVGYGIAQLASVTSRLLFQNKGKLPSLLTPRRFKSQFKPLRFSNEKLKKVLGWNRPFSFDDALNLTYA